MGQGTNSAFGAYLCSVICTLVKLYESWQVYWWRRAFYLQQQAAVALPVSGDNMPSFYEPVAKAASSESEGTNW